MSRQSNNMWMFIVILSTLLVAAECQSDTMLVTTYNDDTSNEGDTPEKNKCLDIQADITGCYSCYYCEDERIIKKSKNNVDIARLNMTDSTCTAKGFCCIAQASFTVRNKAKCGDFYPEGNPRSVRSSLRGVLPGEYPWRAWLYNSSHLLCPATYIREETKVLITSASCIKDNLSGPLFVRFDKNGTPSEVTEKIRHPDPGTDIVVLQVNELPAISWILPCCMPDAPPHFGTTCIAISDDDHFIYTVIPKPSVCATAMAAGGDGVLCAVAPSTDYHPAPGSALICPDHNAKTMKYMVYGIALETTTDGFTKYTNVHRYTDWVESQIENLQQPSSSFVYRTPNRGYHG